jgi:hypothetical protein
MLMLLENGELEIKVTRSATGEPFSEADLAFSKSVVQTALEHGEPLLPATPKSIPGFRGAKASSPSGCAPSCVLQSSTRIHRWELSTWRTVFVRVSSHTATWPHWQHSPVRQPPR